MAAFLAMVFTSFFIGVLYVFLSSDEGESAQARSPCKTFLHFSQRKINTRQTPLPAWFTDSFRFVLVFRLGCVRVWTSEAQSNRTKHKETHHMSTYESLLTASIAYIRKHGKNRKTLDNLESLLPACWAAELIADALDSI